MSSRFISDNNTNSNNKKKKIIVPAAAIISFLLLNSIQFRWYRGKKKLLKEKKNIISVTIYFEKVKCFRKQTIIRSTVVILCFFFPYNKKSTAKKKKKKKKKMPKRKANHEVKITVRDVAVGRSIELSVSEEMKMSDFASGITKRWKEWYARDIVFLNCRHDELVQETIEDCGIEAGDTIQIVSRRVYDQITKKKRSDAHKKEDGDEEEWGVFGDVQQKISLAIKENDQGFLNSTVTWVDEGNTLGNSLRHVLAQDPTVIQCGYVIPHPLENKMVMELSCKEFPPDTIKAGLHSLADVCDLTATRFEEAMSDFDRTMDTD